jgi:hypothetical protein
MTDVTGGASEATAQSEIAELRATISELQGRISHLESALLPELHSLSRSGEVLTQNIHFSSPVELTALISEATWTRRDPPGRPIQNTFEICPL